MTRIKIISNPYKKEIKYQKYNEEQSEWVDINYDNHKDSKLLSNELSGGFFPFRVKQIVDVIREEYGIPGETLELDFEGSNDEYKELEEVCIDDNSDVQVFAVKTGITLENARDILPKVKDLFKEMSPLIMQSVSQEKIQRDLSRFSDASSDKVPVCVLGNYSAGKSTFINALIGNEILPSGIEPITAKVYRIERSEYPDRAFVRFEFLGNKMTLQFRPDETIIDPEGDNHLVLALREGFSGLKGSSIVKRVNKALNIINAYEDGTSDIEISDLIRVEIPFEYGVLAKSQHPFVIFDTPGSNSASNARHLQVLKEAMADMTNGLPIYLSTSDSLDSTDNENLYKIIREMEELDNRFTMIVVNKADGPGLQRKDSTEAEQNRILGQAVPRNLYSGGLFYVSSIMGLGAKNNGEFIDDFYAETFEDHEHKFSNPEERRYKTLYSYNILPSQIKKRSDAIAAEQKDLLYANSGLFSIETEIESFAGKYAAYNKCFQSQMFLNKVINITAEEIEKERAEKEETRQIIKEKLEDDKRQLIEKLENTAQENRQIFDEEYEGYMQQYLAEIDDTFEEDELKAKEKEFTDEYENQMNFDEKQEDTLKAFSEIGDNLISGISDGAKKLKGASVKEAIDAAKESVKAIADELKEDVSNTIESYKEQQDTRHNVDKAVADRLLKYVAEKYDSRLSEIHELLDRESQNYWTNRTEELRNILAKIVSGSEVLTDERRSELEQIIIEYKSVLFNTNAAEKIFVKDKFEKGIRIGNQVLIASDHLRIDKLAETYNSNIDASVTAGYNILQNSHRESAHSWIQSLLDEIYKNIVNYSPELSKQAKQIENMTKKIDDLINRKMKLEEYIEELKQMMDWKQVS